MNLKIREADLSDLKLVDSFQNEIRIHERPLDPNIKSSGKARCYTLEDIKRLIKSKNSIILIIEYGGQPIGCGAGEIVKQHADWSKYKYKGNIGLMFIKKEHRKKGIGRLILKNLIKWFKQKKVEDIRLQVYQNNTTAIELYKKEGFKDYILELIYRPD